MLAANVVQTSCGPIKIYMRATAGPWVPSLGPQLQILPSGEDKGLTWAEKHMWSFDHSLLALSHQP